jgi:hypothetical protein
MIFQIYQLCETIINDNNLQCKSSLILTPYIWMIGNQIITNICVYLLLMSSYKFIISYQNNQQNQKFIYDMRSTITLALWIIIGVSIDVDCVNTFTKEVKNNFCMNLIINIVILFIFVCYQIYNDFIDLNNRIVSDIV